MNGFHRINRVVDVISGYEIEACLIYKVTEKDTIEYDFTIEKFEGDFGLLSMHTLNDKCRRYFIDNKKELIELYNNRKVLNAEKSLSN